MRAAPALLALSLAAACHRPSGSPGDAGAVLEARPAEAASFAAPIAAVRSRDGVTYVAALVPGRAAVALTSIGDDGARRWTIDAFSNVAVSGGDLRVFAFADGAVAVYRAAQGSASSASAVAVARDGKPLGPPTPSGTAACATDASYAWIERGEAGTSRAVRGVWGEPGGKELFVIPAERDPTLICGGRSIFVLADGERDTTMGHSPSASSRLHPVMRDTDFADEEREHDPFVAGDTLGLVRVGQSGAVHLREVAPTGSVGPWRRLHTKLEEGDDVVAVDGDAKDALVVFTREGAEPCDASSGPSVHAVVAAAPPTVTASPVDGGADGGAKAPRAEAGPADADPDAPEEAREEAVELAPAACAVELGPFWTSPLGSGFVIAWVERDAARSPGSPPISALAYRTLTRDGLGALHRIPRAAEAMVDAGCDASRCYAAALVRDAGGEPNQGHLEIVAYP